MNLSEFDYNLPEELIADRPNSMRSESRLLIVGNELIDQKFSNIIDYINPGDLIIVNNSRVIKARLFGHKSSGAKVEILLERIHNEKSFTAHIRTNGTIKIGLQIDLADNLSVTVVDKHDGLFILETNKTLDLYTYFENHGSLPLPPYMNREADTLDYERYQTVYAKNLGSVAAPTAGLHFNAELLDKIRQKNIQIAELTLHVGAGTFKPLKVENINDHKMHSEIFEISQTTIDLILKTKAAGGKIIAVGTTSMRVLESLARDQLVAKRGETDIFISPGFEFKLVDKLITNFHLPKSSLLILVSAFAGKNNIDRAYSHAIKNGYRFFSYGDAMLISRKLI